MRFSLRLIGVVAFSMGMIVRSNAAAQAVETVASCAAKAQEVPTHFSERFRNCLDQVATPALVDGLPWTHRLVHVTESVQARVAFDLTRRIGHTKESAQKLAALLSDARWARKREDWFIALSRDDIGRAEINRLLDEEPPGLLRFKDVLTWLSGVNGDGRWLWPNSPATLSSADRERRARYAEEVWRAYLPLRPIERQFGPLKTKEILQGSRTWPPDMRFWSTEWMQLAPNEQARLLDRLRVLHTVRQRPELAPRWLVLVRADVANGRWSELELELVGGSRYVLPDTVSFLLAGIESPDERLRARSRDLLPWLLEDLSEAQRQELRSHEVEVHRLRRVILDQIQRKAATPRDMGVVYAALESLVSGMSPTELAEVREIAKAAPPYDSLKLLGSLADVNVAERRALLAKLATPDSDELRTVVAALHEHSWARRAMQDRVLAMAAEDMQSRDRRNRLRAFEYFVAKADVRFPLAGQPFRCGNVVDDRTDDGGSIRDATMFEVPYKPFVYGTSPDPPLWKEYTTEEVVQEFQQGLLTMQAAIRAERAEAGGAQH